jgi:branched-chain amino acid transport system substrate-binding protein
LRGVGPLLARRESGGVVGRLVVCLALLVPVTACRYPGAVRPTVRIGLVAPFEGRYRYVGYDVIYAVRLALREANSAGGVGGYNVELVAYDDGADPSMAVQQARKLAIDSEVVAAIGHFQEATTEAAAGVYADEGMPLVVPAVLSASLDGQHPAAFRLAPPAAEVARAVLDCAAWEPENARLTLLGGGSSLGGAVRAKAEGRSMEVDVVSVDAWPAGVDAPEAGEPVVFDAEPVDAGEAAKWLRTLGWTGRLVGGPALLTGDFLAVAGASSEGALIVTPWPLCTDIPDGGEFSEAYQAMGYHVGAPGPLALPAYEATWLVLEALEQDIESHGAPTRSGVAAALAGTERSGYLGEIAFDEQGEWSEAPLYWYQVQEGGTPVLADQGICPCGP